ncbi:MAG: 50S ribosomal protein L18 [Planctomycetes bacterium]|nr:50S ribosomal protein L18 [Planctomycetota bacterium]
MRSTLIKNLRRERRNTRVRSKLREISTLPRLCVTRSVKHIQAQVVDDLAGKTLAHASSTSKEMAGELKGKNKSQRAAVIGTAIAKAALAAGVTSVSFDRGFARYHGRVKALAEAAREAGLKF